MTVRTTIASAMRQLGLGKVVENRVFRTAVGAPMYRRMVDTAEDNPAAASPMATRSTPELRADVPPMSAAQAPALARQAVEEPLLAVIVPAYNVSQYLEECVRSVLDQSFESMEIVIVDDGSTDDTLAIARRLADTDLRLTVITKKNAGLGAARNTGLDAVSAPFITFVDSDDIVTPGAYAAMMGSLESSGSGMAIGSIERFDEVRSWTPAWVPRVHGEDHIGVTGFEFPEMMWDVFAWNKIYRRSVWDVIAGRFPEGTLYEDQECTAKIFISGTPIDVLSKVVYRWRLRHDSSSITQQKTDPDDLRQRIAVMNNVEALIENATEEYRTAWRAKTLGEDFYYYLREVPRGDREFWEVLRTAVSSLWDRCSGDEFLRIAVDRRWIAFAGAMGLEAELEELLIHFERNPNKFQVVESDGRLVAEAPVALEGFPSHLNVVMPDQLSPRVALRKSSVSDDGSLTFEGFAFVENLEADLDVTAALVLSGAESSGQEQSRIPLAVSSADVDEADIVSHHPYIDYARTGRRFTIAPDVIDQIAHAADASESPEWHLEVSLTAADGSAWNSQEVKRTLDLSAGAPLPTPLTPLGHRAVVTGGSAGPTKIIVLTPRFIATEAEVVEGKELRLEIRLGYTGMPSIVRRYRTEELFLEADLGGMIVVRAPMEQVDDSTWRARALLPDHVGKQAVALRKYPLYVVSSQGLKSAVASETGSWSRETTSANGLSTTSYGFLDLHRAAVYATARESEVSEHGDRVTFRGTYFADPRGVRTQSPTFALVGELKNISPINMSHDAKTHEFEVSFPLITKDANGNSVAIDSGRYVLQVLLPSGTGMPTSVWVTSGVEFESQFPARVESKFVSLRFSASATARSVTMHVAAPGWRESETRRYQHEMGRTFIAPRHTGVRDTVLFESFAGSSVSDSPLAIDRQLAYHAPELKRYWTVSNRSVAVPNGATPVLLHSREWYELARSSKLLVNNNNFIPAFRKTQGQTYVQTWHGTPLKKIGLDVPSKNLSLQYRQLINRESAEYWDLLLAQSPWASDTIRRAFAYQGPISAEGYPRNDILSPGTNAEERRRLVRKHLSLGDMQKVVLYAPTWRDNMKDASGHYSRVDFLNLKRVASKLGPGYSILYRSHSNGANAKAVRTPPGVIDVTLHPSVNDLILASDLLVTDYSSIMFDYVVTGRPIVFMTPDLEHYAGETRGFYFDFKTHAPGPIVRTPDQAVESIVAELSVSSRRNASYWKFLEDFAPLDDGHAGERVTREILARMA